ncbi:LytR/AlgR family response regulator transcription factor [Fulvivirga lutea]|uniref:Response regulator transcription factor n=1 Tax=Fulvivirga lutea TaxID=2810512 RepID=A0A974WFM5_9BACT|nr:LytTR family DNA-binding domain-containing protein [Fulvivirga lutea]QSE97604.1 response regulator transcription factor [Fulvivirga lutea]
MNKTAVIVEDEKHTAERLSGLISDLTSINVVAHISSVKAAMQWFGQNELPDVIFLDIHLGDGTGFDVLEFVEGYPYIIFTTAYDQYTLDAFQYNSVDYLLKPIKPKELAKAILKIDKIQPQSYGMAVDKARNQLEKKYKGRFLFKVGSKYQQVLAKDIAYFYSNDGLNYARKTTGENFVTDCTMDELEQVLDPTDFFRCNRGMIIRADNIKEIHTYFNGRLLLDCQPKFEYDEVLVSREKVKDFKNWLDG